MNLPRPNRPISQASEQSATTRMMTTNPNRRKRLPSRAKHQSGASRLSSPFSVSEIHSNQRLLFLFQAQVRMSVRTCSRSEPVPLVAAPTRRKRWDHGAFLDSCAFFLEILVEHRYADENSALIALVVYILGGVAYQRTVMHQRGWRQLPNYSMWAGIASFAKVSSQRRLSSYILQISIAANVNDNSDAHTFRTSFLQLLTLVGHLHHSHFLLRSHPPFPPRL